MATVEDAAGVARFARADHDRAAESARRRLERPNTLVVVASCDDAGLPRRIAILRLADESVAYDAAVAPPYDQALAELDRLFTSAGVIWTERHGLAETQGIDVLEWDRATGMGAAIRLLNLDGARHGRASPQVSLAPARLALGRMDVRAVVRRADSAS